MVWKTSKHSGVEISIGKNDDAILRTADKRMFSFLSDVSLSEYIRRRLALAALELRA